MLGPLANNGGQTLTHGLRSGSPAIDAGSSGGALTDQRGLPRPSDLPGIVNAGDAADMGAVEVQFAQVQTAPLLIVNTIEDSDDGTCSFGHCSLREALNAASASAISNTVLLNVTGTINLSNALPILNGDLAIRGGGPGSVTVRRQSGGDYRIFTVLSNANVALVGMTMGNGHPANFGDGGGIHNAGTLTLMDCAVSGNRAYDGGGILNEGSLLIENSVIADNRITFDGYGGGIYNRAGLIRIQGSTVSGNQSGNDLSDGGGIFNGGTLEIAHTVITGNSAPAGGGGGIYSAVTSTCTLSNSIVSGNVAIAGGGILNEQGTVKLRRTTVSGNNAYDDDGGGILNIGTMEILASTLSGNSADFSGGGMANAGTLTVDSSTIALNVAFDGGGMSSFFGTVNLRNSILASNRLHIPLGTGHDGQGSVVSQDYNLIQNTNGLAVTGQTAHNIVGLNPLLLPLGNYGGPTPTHNLQTNSPAIDAGNCGDIPFDQRGIFRPIDVFGIPDASDSCDIGAIEFGIQAGPDYVVNTTNDVDDGACTVGHCSLREAIAAANADGTNSTIAFANGLTGAINLTGALEVLRTDMALNGPGATNLTVRRDTGGQYRIFTVASNAVVTISSLRLVDGYVELEGGGGVLNFGTLNMRDSHVSGNRAYDGGGIHNFSGTLTLSNVFVSGNSISHDGYGGGIYNNGATVHVFDSIISGNSSGNDISDGGGIYNPLSAGIVTVTRTLISANAAFAGVGGGIYNAGQLTISSSTVFGNLAIAGGGILNEGGTLQISSSTIANNNAYDDDGGGLWNSGSMTLLNCTVSGNSSDFTGGGIFAAGTVHIMSSTVAANLAFDGGGIFGNATIQNTIVAANGLHTTLGTGPDCQGTLNSQGYNLVQNTSGCNLLLGAQDIFGVEPRLAPLAFNGGSTLTHALTNGSPAIDRGNSNVSTDQRGLPRPINNPDFSDAPGGNASDIGAFEADASVPDGLSDDWEQNFFGHIGFGPIDDPDGDGMNNSGEFHAGTSPSSAAEVLKITCVERSSGTNQLCFSSVAGKLYRVERNETLGTGTGWSLVLDNVPGTGTDVRVADDTGAGLGQVFYRVRVLP